MKRVPAKGVGRVFVRSHAPIKGMLFESCACVPATIHARKGVFNLNTKDTKNTKGKGEGDSDLPVLETVYFKLNFIPRCDPSNPSRS
jgi:hypothetical protein